MSDDKFDLTHLVIRTDEKYEQTRAEMHDLQMGHKDLENTVERIEKRIDFGVAVTGQKNADELARQAVDIGQLKQTQALQGQKVVDLEKDLSGKLDRISESVALIYKGIVTIFFTMVIGGLILYGLKFFHFS